MIVIFSFFHEALSLRNDDVANVLEKYGADRNHDLKSVIEDELQQLEATKESREKDERRTSSRAFMKEPSLEFDRLGSENDDDIDVLLIQAANKFRGS